MTLPPDDFLEEHLKELNRTLSEASAAQRAEEERAQRSGVGRRADDHNWRRWLAEHLPAFFGVLGFMAMAVGALGARVLGNEEREHAQFRQGIESLNKWVSEVQRTQDQHGRMLAQYGDDSKEAKLLMQEFVRENYNHYRAAALARGDDAVVRRLDKKLKALTAGNATGQ